MRGLACLLMFQTHCYDSWLGGDARKSAFLTWSQLGGTLPAPLFLFLAGISFAFLFQVYVNVGMTIGIAPITGIPLPLVSVGGSSMIANLIAIGILEAICVRGGRRRA